MNKRDDLKSAGEALKEQQEIMTLTAGISMQPMLREHKDIAVIRRTDGVRLKKFDVPLYCRADSDKYILHRIIKVTEDGYVIRGDNLFTNEYDITDNEIVGVLMSFYRSGKYYDCKKSFKYKLYVICNVYSYPLRHLWRKHLRPFLGRVKRKLFNQIKNE